MGDNVHIDGMALDGSGALILDPRRTSGTWSLLVPGCQDKDGSTESTTWLILSWSRDLPAGSSLTMRARSSDAATLDAAAWSAAARTVAQQASPMMLAPPTLTPNATVLERLQGDVVPGGTSGSRWR